MGDQIAVVEALEERIEAQREAVRTLGTKIEAFKRRLHGDDGELDALMVEAEEAIRETVHCIETAGVAKSDLLELHALLRELVHAAVQVGYEHRRERPT